MIADTTFLVDVLRNTDERVQKKVQEIEKTFSMKAVASITAMELWSGAYRAENKKKQVQNVGKILSSFVIYPFDDKDAEIAGKIEAKLISQGKMIEPNDIIIAAIAINRNEPVLTRNVKHFSRISGLTVETY